MAKYKKRTKFICANPMELSMECGDCHISVSIWKTKECPHCGKIMKLWLK